MDRTKWNLTEVILGVPRRRTRKLSVCWMLPPMDSRIWNDHFTDREHKIFPLPVIIMLFIIIIISLWADFWQEPEPSQATGMALVHCILGKFLGVVCHCSLVIIKLQR
jgi:hypothetical protein